MNPTVCIGLPKGRLFDQAVALLDRAGITDRSLFSDSRRLIVRSVGTGVDCVAFKPVDIPVYVESGAIDAGIVGSDILREMNSDVFEPVDLRIGRCTLALAARSGAILEYNQALRIATKYPRTAEAFFRSRNAHVQVVRLDGSVEIAPILGLADAIVDVVETGQTLRENGMVVIEEIAKVSAKFIVNRTAMKVKARPLAAMIKQLDALVYEND